MKNLQLDDYELELIVSSLETQKNIFINSIGMEDDEGLSDSFAEFMIIQHENLIRKINNL